MKKLLALFLAVALPAAAQTYPSLQVNPSNGQPVNPPQVSGAATIDFTQLHFILTSSQAQAIIGAGVYDASGAAATAQSTAEAYAANSSNQSSGTVAIARLPTGATSTTVALGYVAFQHKTANFTAAVGATYGVDTTSASLTVTLPSSPADGDWFVVFDVAKKWATNQCVIGTSGANFVDTTHTSATAGPYDLNAIPYVGQGFVRFVWDSTLSAWSVN